jgi:hypothetical protein
LCEKLLSFPPGIVLSGRRWWLSSELGLVIISGKMQWEKSGMDVRKLCFMLFFFGSLSGLEIMFWFWVQLAVDWREFWEKNKKKTSKHLLWKFLGIRTHSTLNFAEVLTTLIPTHLLHQLLVENKRKIISPCSLFFLPFVSFQFIFVGLERKTSSATFIESKNLGFLNNFQKISDKFKSKKTPRKIFKILEKPLKIPSKISGISNWILSFFFLLELRWISLRLNGTRMVLFCKLRGETNTNIFENFFHD